MPLSVHYLLWSLLLQPLVNSQIVPENTRFELVNVCANDVSAACEASFYEKVSCSWRLYEIADGKGFPSGYLSTICTDTCLSELKALRAKQLSVCSSSDFLTWGDARLPPTYSTDLLLHTYHYACVTDPVTEDYCSPDFFKWNSLEEGVTSAELCSDCNLLVQQAHLDSPIGYHADLASAYSSLTSSCEVTRYPISSQPPYLLNEAATPTTTTPPNSPIQTASYDSRFHPGMGYNKGPDFHMGEPANHSISFRLTHAWGPPTSIDNTSRIPLAPGTADSCKRYATNTRVWRDRLNECDWVARLNCISTAQFLSWNPSLSFDAANPSDCVLGWSYRYCVSKPATTTSNSSNATTLFPSENISSESPTITYSPDDGSDTQKKLDSL